MIDNFLQDDYHSYDQVYRNPQTSTSIFIGDVQSALDLQFIKSCNIKTVVTAAKDMDHISYQDDTLHIVYPLLDGKNQDIAAFFDSFYDLVQVNLSKGSILVHCAAGISRSSTLVISYIMKKQKMSFKDAISSIRKARPTVLPNLGFERQLKKYEEILKKASKQSRNSRRNDVKTSQSGKSQLLLKTQLLPALGMLGKFRLKEKMMSANVKHVMDKITEKDMQVLKIYNGRNDSKMKKFVINKKCSSFSKPQQERQLAIKSALPESNESRQSTKNMERIKRKAKTPLQEMKEIYLSRKNGAFLERRNPTDRGHTFYNLRAKQKIQM